MKTLAGWYAAATNNSAGPGGEVRMLTPTQLIDLLQILTNSQKELSFSVTARSDTPTPDNCLFIDQTLGTYRLSITCFLDRFTLSAYLHAFDCWHPVTEVIIPSGTSIELLSILSLTYRAEL